MPFLAPKTSFRQKFGRIIIIIGSGAVLLGAAYFGLPSLLVKIEALTTPAPLPVRDLDLGDTVRDERRPLAEVHTTVRAKPTIRAGQDLSYLVFPAVEGRTVEVDFDPKREPQWYQSMPKDRVLTFTMWQTKTVMRRYKSGYEDVWWYSELESVSDGAEVYYDARICPLHKTQMERGEIEIRYGLPMADFMEAMEKEFYGGPGFELGGCCVTPEKKAFGYRCAECIAAYQKWSAARKSRRDALKETKIQTTIQ